MAVETKRWDVQDFLRTPEDCAPYIQAATVLKLLAALGLRMHVEHAPSA